jgi:NAD+ diphosphatase
LTTWRYCPQCASALADEWRDGALRRVCGCEGCEFVQWNNPLPVVAALVELVDRGSQVVLARNRAWPEKQFGLITGFLEAGEAPDQAALREVKEELGLDGTIVSLIGNYAFARQQQVIMAYHVRASGTPVLGEELAEIRLIDPQRLRAWDYGTGPAVADWLAARIG